ncbi:MULTISPECIES: DUF6428 family protein [Emticicia]|uniref:DUF6428 family protein n=1 Tax=Emticicia TaxID=312278 RepID=UPI0007D89A58|nr:MULTISPECIES: DUF6428 family protein [Emticicia]
MKLSEIKNALEGLEAVNFQLPDGSFVPESFHVTEVGVVNKYFIDCGGTVRNERVVNFQLWNANDYDHRLKPQKLLNIISLSERVLGIEDSEIEVEYQGETIGKYNLGFTGNHFLLLAKQTACLAEDQCGIPPQKQKINLGELKAQPQSSCCTPGSGCC